MGPTSRTGEAKGHYREDERYTATPVQRESNRGALYEEYQAGITTWKATLGILNNRAQAELEAIQTRWDLERQKISRESFGRHKFDLLKITRLHESKNRLQVRKRINAERERVRQETPYATWADFLKWKAGQGNETALAILRSKELDNKAPHRGQREGVQEKWLKKQLEITTFVDLSSRARRSLLAVAKKRGPSDFSVGRCPAMVFPGG